MTALDHHRLRLTAGLAIVLASGALAGCGDDEPPARGSAGATATSGGYPVTIENCGRTLTFDETPSRVVVSYPPIVEIFVGLGLADRAIARTGTASRAKLRVLREQAAGLERLPVISKDYLPAKEKLLTMRPDLVVALAEFEFGDHKSPGRPGLATVADLKAVGAQTFVTLCSDGEKEAGAGYGRETLASTYKAILDIGTIFDVRERAERRVAEMKQQIAAVRAKVSEQPRLKVFAYNGGKGPLMAAGGPGLVTELLDAAGADNIFAGENLYFETSLESVASRPADAYLIFDDAGKVSDAKRFLAKTFPDKPASRNRRFAVTNYQFTTTGWRLAQTAEDLARQLHPDAFDTPSATQQYSDQPGGR